MPIVPATRQNVFGATGILPVIHGQARCLSQQNCQAFSETATLAEGL